MLGLTVIFVYAFFKFAWSYRLFNYFAIMVGAAPPPAEKDTADGAGLRPSRRDGCAPTPAAISTAASAPSSSRSAISAGSWGPSRSRCPPPAILVVMWRRQFNSDARKAFAPGALQ